MKWVSTNPSLGAGKSSPAMALPPELVRLARRSCASVYPARWVLLLRRPVAGPVRGRCSAPLIAAEGSDAGVWRFPPETTSFLLELRSDNSKQGIVRPPR